MLRCIISQKWLYLSSLHDFFGFGVEVEIAPQSLEQNPEADAHFLTVHLSKLMDSVRALQKIQFSTIICTCYLPFYFIPFSMVSTTHEFCNYTIKIQHFTTKFKMANAQNSWYQSTRYAALNQKRPSLWFLGM